MGTETNDAFINNLGIGAMSNAFSIPTGNAAFWSGDYLANGVGGNIGNGYNGFNVAFTDTEGTSPVNGTQYTASGFWITNLGGNTFTGNSIAGCQAVGRGFWILPGNNTPAVTASICAIRYTRRMSGLLPPRRRAREATSATATNSRSSLIATSALPASRWFRAARLRLQCRALTRYR